MNVDFQEQDIIIEFTPEGQDGKSIRPRGDWSATAQYVELDLVSYQGSTYIAQKIVPVGTLPTDTEYWMINASNETPYWGTIAGMLSDQTDLQNALDAKANANEVYTKTETDTLLAEKANSDDVYTKSETDDLLDLKANAADVYTQTELDGIFDGIDNALTTKADKTDVYTKAETTNLLSAKADSDDVYTKAEADALLSDKADSDDVYTKTETDTLLGAKANTSDLGDLASQDSIAYDSNYLTGKPTLGTMSAINDAPSDGKTYGRKDGQWAEVEGGGGGGSAEWGAITGTLSDQTDLSNALLSKAPVILNTASGSIASFADGSPAPVTALSVGIEPVQDLHGYSNPWPAGGGKNKFVGKALSETVRTINFAFTADDVLTVSGTNNSDSASAYFTIYANESGQRMPVKAGTWTFSSKVAIPTGMQVTLTMRDSGGTNLGNYVLTSSQQYVSGTVNADCEANVNVAVAQSASVTYNGGLQLESGSSKTDWSPYSNVCPISGHTSAVVTRTGKNLCYKVLPNSETLYSASDGIVHLQVLSSAGTTACFKSVKGQTYRVSGATGRNRSIVGYYNADPVVNSISNSAYQPILYPTDDGFVFTAQQTAYCACYLANSILPDVNIQIELGSSATTYEPYQGTSVTIDLGGTRYGGELNVLTGELTVTHKAYTMDGTETWKSGNYGYGRRYYTTNKITDALNGQYIMMSSALPPYDENGNIWLRIDTAEAANQMDLRMKTAYPLFNTLAEWTTYLTNNPITFLYELATPITVQLTANQMQTLIGQNAIWADTGDTSVEYRADTKLFIEKLTKPTEDDMTANTNIASGKYFMVGNSLYLSTASIAQGDAIVPGTNCTPTSLAEALNAINA